MDDGDLENAIGVATATDALFNEAAILNDLRQPGASILVAFAANARSKAIEATAELLEVNAEDPKAIRHLQNEIARYRDLVAWVHDGLNHGRDARAFMGSVTEAQAAELAKILGTLPEINDA